MNLINTMLGSCVKSRNDGLKSVCKDLLRLPFKTDSGGGSVIVEKMPVKKPTKTPAPKKAGDKKQSTTNEM